MEAHWIAKRSQLRQLVQDQPQWTNQMLSDAVGMSVSWIKDWKWVFRSADPDDEEVVLGRPRHHRTPLEGVSLRSVKPKIEVIERIRKIKVTKLISKDTSIMSESTKFSPRASLIALGNYLENTLIWQIIEQEVAKAP